MNADHSSVSQIYAIYDADGGPVGEVSYAFAKIFGKAHCALCDITHSPVRRKPQWDQFVSALPIPLTLLHRNQLAGDLAPYVLQVGLPVVVARHANGSLATLIGPAELETFDGSVPAFAHAVQASLTQS